MSVRAPLILLKPALSPLPNPQEQAANIIRNFQIGHPGLTSRTNNVYEVGTEKCVMKRRIRRPQKAEKWLGVVQRSNLKRKGKLFLQAFDIRRLRPLRRRCAQTLQSPVTHPFFPELSLALFLQGLLVLAFADIAGSSRSASACPCRGMLAPVDNFGRRLAIVFSRVVTDRSPDNK